MAYNVNLMNIMWQFRWAPRCKIGCFQPEVPEGVPGGPQINDGELVI